MESEEQEKETLIRDIQADARVEAEGILKEAEAQIADKKKYAGLQVESLLNDARRSAQEQAEAIRKKAASAVALEVKRRQMHRQADVARDIMERVEKRLAAMVGDARYRAVLVDWIAEAAVGLGAESARVNASQQERAMIDDCLLAEATEKVRAATGGQIALALSADPPLPAQGVVLTAADGRTAFNNQVKTRMGRWHRQIEALIHDSLFDSREERV